MNEFVNTQSGLLALLPLILAIFAVISGVAFFVRLDRKDYIEKQLMDPEGRKRIKDGIRRQGVDAYIGAVRGVRDSASRWYGDKLFSVRSFGLSLQLSLVYAFLGSLLAWVLFDQTSPGGYPLFPEDINAWGRGVVAAVIIICLARFIIAFRSMPKFEQLLRGSLLGYAQRMGFHSKMTPWVFFVSKLLAAALAIVVAIAAVLVVVLIAVIAIMLFLSIFGGGLLLLTLYASGALIVQLNGFTTLTFFGLFLIILPLLNAIADFCSVGCTRLFLTLIGAEKRPLMMKIIAALIADVVIALICLVGLVTWLQFALDFWGYMSPETLPLDWRAYWAAARIDWRDGFALWFMIGTTLVPTFVHVLAGLGAVVTQWAHLKRGVLHQIEAWEAEGVDRFTQGNCNYLAHRIWRADIAGVMIATIGLCVLVFGVVWVLA